MPETKCLIIADDLSGAADCAAGCAIRGLPTRVLLGVPSTGHTATAALAVDLNSRDRAAEGSALAVSDAIRRLHPARGALYLKIDSTLRGNWASDLIAARHAIADVTGRRALAIVAPAFPALGRTTLHGRVLVHSLPLERAQDAAHSSAPRQAGEIAAPLVRSGLAVRSLGLADVRQGAELLAASLRGAADGGVDAVIADAETDDDLRRVVAGVLAANIEAFWVGSGGLMRQLAPVLGKSGLVISPLPRCPSPRLFVVGSAAGVSHHQYEQLTTQRDVLAISAAPDDLLGGHVGAMRDLERQLDLAIDADRDVAVEIARRLPSDAALDARLTAALASMVAPRLARAGALVATGGATVRSILEAASVTGIELGGEIEPGVPWGRTLGSLKLPIITKAGGFGDPGTLLRCRDALEGDR
jgi:D-threonate/D-erythronate kinase